MIIIKNYFEGYPKAWKNQRFLTGRELTILVKIFLRSKPVIAAIGLFYLIYNWNIFMPQCSFSPIRANTRFRSY